METNYKSLLNSIKAFVLDVDGVLTDGTLYLLQGEQYRAMNIRDGYAMAEAVKAGYHLMVISGGSSESVRTRLQGLGIEEVFLGVEDKLSTLEMLMKKYNLTREQILYMGDDLPDFTVIQAAGLRTCPADAAPEIKSMCQYISPIAGGKGCVRDVIEQVMKAQKSWPYQH